MRSGNAVSSHGGLILFETVYEKRGGLICFDWLLDFLQVDLTSFLASGASFSGLEAAMRATKSRTVDLSPLRGCHLRFPPNMESGVIGLWSFKLHLRVLDLLIPLRQNQSNACVFLWLWISKFIYFVSNLSQTQILIQRNGKRSSECDTGKQKNHSNKRALFGSAWCSPFGRH